MVLGAPLGSAAYVRIALRSKRQEHGSLFEKIPCGLDMHSAWLLFLLCEATRSNYLVARRRLLHPQRLHACFAAPATRAPSMPLRGQASRHLGQRSRVCRKAGGSSRQQRVFA